MAPTCPCGTGRPYKKCCRVYHRGRPVPTPEALMRSRFSAYALDLPEYIIATTHPDGPQWQPDRAAWLASIREFSATTAFADLQVLAARTAGDSGTVVFRCVLTQGEATRMFSEESLFQRQGRTWKYHSGQVG